MRRLHPRSGCSRLVAVSVLLLTVYSTAFPTLGRAYPAVESLRPLALLVGLLLIAHIGLKTRHNEPNPIRLFAIAPIALAAATILRGEYSALPVSLTSATVLLLISLAPGVDYVRGVKFFLLVVLSASILAAMAWDFAAIAGRDFLPFIIDGRALGVLASPNNLGIHAGVAVLLAMSPGSWGRLDLVLGMLGVIALLASASQTSLIATTAGGAIVLAKGAGDKYGRVLVLTSMALLSLAVYLIIDLIFFGERIGSSVDVSFTGRTIIWEALLRQDVGAFGLSQVQFLVVTQQAYGVSSAHNLWLELWARAGAFGVLAALVIALRLVVVGWRTRRDLGLAGVAFFAVLSVMEGVILTVPLILVVGALFVAAHAEQKPQREAEPLSAKTPIG